MKFRSLILSLVLLASLATVPACSLFQGTNTPSSQVLSEVRLAETAYLTAITIINVRAADSGKPVSNDVKEAEAIVFAYLSAAKEAAAKGDTVTVDQKLDLFNDALRKFNEQYVGATPATQP